MAMKQKELKEIKDKQPSPGPAAGRTEEEAIVEAFFQDTKGRAVIDEDLCWVTFNHTYKEEFKIFFGIEPRLGISLRELKPTNQKAFDLIIEDVLQALKGKLKVKRSIRQIPSPVTINIYFQPIRLPNKKKAVMITGVKQEKEEALWGSVNKLQDFTDLAELIPHMVWVTDAIGSINYINIYWTQYTGLSTNGLLTQKYSKAVHDEDRPLVLEAWKEAVEKDIPFEKELRIRNKEGIYRWFLSRATSIKDGQGHILRWVGVTLDIHDYKQLQESIEQQQLFLAALADIVPAFILFLDQDGLIRFGNKSHQRLGFQVEELIGQPFHTAYHLKDPAYASLLNEAIEKALEGSEEKVAGRIYDIHGKAIEVETILYPYKQDLVGPQGVTLVSFDVTHHTTLQQNLKDQKKALEEVNQDFDTLFHQMAHDLYSPLSAVEGLIQLLIQESAEKEENRTLLLHISSSLKKFRKAVSNITSLVGMSVSEREKNEAVFLPDLMSSLLWDMQETITLTNTTVNTVYEVNHFSLSDRNLRSILYNTISNAIKYRKKEVPPLINVRFFENEQYAYCLEVKDNGIGINAGDLHRVTQAYEKLNPNSEGLGLGMYVVNRIVNRYEGTIHLESTVGEGTCIQVFLCPRQNV